MIKLLTVDDHEYRISGTANAVARHLLLDAIDDIGSEIEDIARSNAPGSLGGPEGLGVERFGAGALDPTSPAIGGGLSFRGGNPGNRGQFSKRPTGVFEGDHFASVVQVPERPEHARWVHQGTGEFGPHATPIVPHTSSHLWFYAYGKKWKLASVRGQEAQPYLAEAVEIVRSTYVPQRLGRLRAEIKALT